MRTLEWEPSAKTLKMIDQREIPSQFTYLHLKNFQEVADSIRDMAVRGAPAIGVAAAYGIVLAAETAPDETITGIRNSLKQAAEILGAARPTAVNLPWALNRMLTVSSQDFQNAQSLKTALLAEADRMADEDVETNLAIAKNGADLIEDGDTIIHHCNTGALATVDWGTALGVIRMAHEQGKRIHVLVDETRPRLQGSRLTAWELKQYSIPFDLICDGAAGHFLRSGLVNKVLFGADRVARNGDVANKIGSYMLALAAHANHVPVYSVFPMSTVDLEIANGNEIPIEERPQDEVLELKFQDQLASPQGTSARNPAFDVTPNELITGWITEMQVIYPPFEKKLLEAVKTKGIVGE
ncbi:MAG: S-methyl-5-thioribose-1-phosphate isomerase [Chloroflexi bacterium]|nr:S-methyl-5-thioribose-1-phosphate isomerase [Chloroflexota bacterium]